MSTIQNLFEQAQLAEAAYADFLKPNTTPEQALKAEGFSEAQAADFVTHWRVVSQQPDTVPNGFSATVFQNIDTGQYSLSIRGSTGAQWLKDFQDDAKLITTDGVAVSQLVDLYNYWQSLTHLGVYQAAKLTAQSLESSFLTGLYRLNGAGVPTALLDLYAGVTIPTTYDAARAFFVSYGFIVKGGEVYKLETDVLSTTLKPQ